MAGSKFGNEIRTGRQRKGWSLRQLGERLRKADGTTMSPQYLNDVEHGRRNPPDDSIIQQLAQELELDVAVLMALAGREPREVKEYLEEMPDAGLPIGRLFRKAREGGFNNWDEVEKLIEKASKRR